MSNYCIYKHISPNGKVYIGITSQNPIRRWNEGLGYKNQVFFNAILKYGWDNIKHEILFTGLSKEEACEKEIELIAFYKSNDSKCGYNISSGGECSNSGSRRIGKIYFNKYKVLGLNGDKYTLLCLNCNKTFERSSGCFNKSSIIKCPFEVHRKLQKQYNYITYKNITHTVTEWSKILNVPVGTLRYRQKNNLDLLNPKNNIIQCVICGKTFKRRDKQNKYCSKECHYKGLRKT